LALGIALYEFLGRAGGVPDGCVGNMGWQVVGRSAPNYPVDWKVHGVALALSGWIASIVGEKPAGDKP
jgi:hypothetical protein